MACTCLAVTFPQHFERLEPVVVQNSVPQSLLQFLHGPRLGYYSQQMTQPQATRREAKEPTPTITRQAKELPTRPEMLQITRASTGPLLRDSRSNLPQRASLEGARTNFENNNAAAVTKIPANYRDAHSQFGEARANFRESRKQLDDSIAKIAEARTPRKESDNKKKPIPERKLKKKPAPVAKQQKKRAFESAGTVFYAEPHHQIVLEHQPTFTFDNSHEIVYENPQSRVFHQDPHSRVFHQEPDHVFATSVAGPHIGTAQHDIHFAASPDHIVPTYHHHAEPKYHVSNFCTLSLIKHVTAFLGFL